MPVTFEGLFGWAHLPRGLAQDTGVVVISPLGRDERCVHLPVRLLCDDLAAAGFPTLRYDHRGEGDSLGLANEEDDAVVEWLKGVDQAIAALRERSGVKRVVLAGLRIGGALAVLKASKADGLMLLAPVLNGKSWLNRLRFSAGAASPRSDEAQPPLDVAGLHLSSATTVGVAAINLLDVPVPSIPMFVAAQNAMVSNYARGLREGGAAATIGNFPGFDALFVDAHSNEPPQAVFEQAKQWLTETFAAPTGHRAVIAFSGPAPELRHAHGVERPVSFGGGLQGMLSLPDAPAHDSPAVLFLNTGGDPRSGIGGFTTKAARQLAAHGIRSLRFDFAGLGDSPMSEGKLRSHIFETPREADMDAAIAFLAAQGPKNMGDGAVVVAGVCAGAYHAVRSASRDHRVTGVFAVSPVKLVWRRGDSLAFGRRDEGKATRAYFDALSQPVHRKRLLAGEVDLKTISRTLALRMKSHTLGVVNRQRSNSPLAGMRAFARRGGRACLLMGLDDVSLDELEVHFGPGGRDLMKAANMTVDINPRLDHGLAKRESQQIALAALIDWLTSRRPLRLQHRHLGDPYATSSLSLGPAQNTASGPEVADSFVASDMLLN